MGIDVKESLRRMSKLVVKRMRKTKLAKWVKERKQRKFSERLLKLFPEWHALEEEVQREFAAAAAQPWPYATPYLVPKDDFYVPSEEKCGAGRFYINSGINDNANYIIHPPKHPRLEKVKIFFLKMIR